MLTKPAPDFIPQTTNHAQLIDAVAYEITNPIQALSNFVENTIQGFVYDISEKGLTQGRPLDIDISFHHTANKQAYLSITDNGPGVNPSLFKNLLGYGGKQKRMLRTRDDLTEYDCAEHGIGFRLNALRLADTCLVLSKFKVKG